MRHPHPHSSAHQSVLELVHAALALSGAANESKCVGQDRLTAIELPQPAYESD